MAEPSTTDWISALSGVGGMMIAAIAAYLAYKEYLKPPVQQPEPQTANASSAEIDETELVVFQTSKQRTLLKVGAAGLECWLLDKPTKDDKHQWTISPAEVNRILADKDVAVTPGYKANSGLFKIGKRRNWLYSKKLFPEPDYLHGELTDLLKKVL